MIKVWKIWLVLIAVDGRMNKDTLLFKEIV